MPVIQFSETTFAYATETELYNQFYESLILLDENEEEIPSARDEFEFSIDTREVGTRTVTVTWTPSSYNNNKVFYKSATETEEVTIKKGTATVTVTSYDFTYGQGQVNKDDLFKVTPAESKVIGFIVGITANGDVFVDIEANNIVLNDFSDKDIPSIHIPFVGEIGGDTPILKILGLDGDSIKLGEVQEKFAKAQEVLETITYWAGKAGIEVNINTDFINNINSTLSQILEMYPDAAKASVSFGVMPTEAGVYTVWGVTTNPNYKTSIGVGTIVIHQEKESDTLNFNDDTIGGTLTLSEAKTKDFGYTYVGKGKVESVLLKDTKPVDSITAENIEPGLYSQTYYVFGNQRAFISRTFIVKRDEVNLTIDAEDVYYNGSEQGVTPHVYAQDGEEIKDAEFTFHYFGVTADHKFYNSGTAPKNAGTYYAIVTYKGDDTHQFKVATSGRYKIKKISANVDFYISITGDEIEYGQPVPSFTPGLFVSTEAETQISSELADKIEEQLTNGVRYLDSNGNELTDAHVGTYTITTSISSINKEILNNFENPEEQIIIHSISFAVTKAKTSIDISNTNFDYNGEDHQATVAVYCTYDTEKKNPIKDAEVTISYALPDGTALDGFPVNAGTYIVTAEYAGDESHEASTATATFTINKIAPTITLSNVFDGYYTGDKNTHAVTASPASIDGVAVKVTYTSSDGIESEIPPIDADEYSVAAEYAGDANHEAVIVKEVFEICKIDTAITYKIKNKQITYGKEIPAIEAELTIADSAQLPEGSNIYDIVFKNLSSNLKYKDVAKPENAGKYTITTTCTIDEDILKNFTSEIKIVDGTLTINKLKTKIVIKDVYNGYYDLNTHPVKAFVYEDKELLINNYLIC